MLVYLLELRKRIIYSLSCYASLFLIFFFFANDLFYLLVGPLLKVLPQGQTLIATHLVSPVLTPIKLAADAALLSTAPFALLQLWRFIAPGLYKRERHSIRNVIIISLLLFCLGILFCFYLILPFMFQFFVNTIPQGVKFMPDMAYALDFITQMLLLFGFCFQVPLVCCLFVHIGYIDLKLLKTIRPYVIVAAFILGMLLTPPDVMSQIMLAIPLCLLYEIGILLAALPLIVYPKHRV